MEVGHNWRELLADITSTPRERQRLAHELGVSPITITRWIDRQADPRPQNLRHLLDIFHEYHDLRHESIEEEIPNIADIETADNVVIDIPSAFYARVFNACTTVLESLRFWSVCNLIMQEAIGQLDPDRLGLLITVLRCFASTRSKTIHSLRHTTHHAAYPSTNNIHQT